jgi:lipid-A-disaccharide synthase-like uncharacterized protein
VFDVIGIIGIGISVIAYLPQVVHLGREHCSAGVSRRAWAMWLVSGLLVGSLAVHRRDPVFIMLQVASVTSAAVILVLARRFRGMVCATHAHVIPSGAAPADPRECRVPSVPAGNEELEAEEYGAPEAPPIGVGLNTRQIAAVLPLFTGVCATATVWMLARSFLGATRAMCRPRGDRPRRGRRQGSSSLRSGSDRW